MGRVLYGFCKFLDESHPLHFQTKNPAAMRPVAAATDPMAIPTVSAPWDSRDEDCCICVGGAGRGGVLGSWCGGWGAGEGESTGSAGGSCELLGGGDSAGGGGEAVECGSGSGSGSGCGEFGGECGGGRGGGKSMPAHIIPSLMYEPTGLATHKALGTAGTLAI